MCFSILKFSDNRTPEMYPLKSPEAFQRDQIDKNETVKKIYVSILI